MPGLPSSTMYLKVFPWDACRHSPCATIARGSRFASRRKTWPCNSHPSRVIPDQSQISDGLYLACKQAEINLDKYCKFLIILLIHFKFIKDREMYKNVIAATVS